MSDMQILNMSFFLFFSTIFSTFIGKGNLNRGKYKIIDAFYSIYCDIREICVILQPKNVRLIFF